MMFGLRGVRRALQELKLLGFREQVRYCMDPGACYHAYTRITHALAAIISKPFRRFLLHSFANRAARRPRRKMLETVWRTHSISFTNAGHLLVSALRPAAANHVRPSLAGSTAGCPSI